MVKSRKERDRDLVPESTESAQKPFCACSPTMEAPGKAPRSAWLDPAWKRCDSLGYGPIVAWGVHEYHDRERPALGSK
jgi:hypothetical protein